MCRGAAGGNTSIVWNGLDLLSRAVESGGLNDFSGLNLESLVLAEHPNSTCSGLLKTGWVYKLFTKISQSKFSSTKQLRRPKAAWGVWSPRCIVDAHRGRLCEGTYFQSCWKGQSQMCYENVTFKSSLWGKSLQSKR